MYHQVLTVQCRNNVKEQAREKSLWNGVSEKALPRREGGFRQEGWAPRRTGFGWRKATSGQKTPVCKVSNGQVHLGIPKEIGLAGTEGMLGAGP